MSSAKSIQSKFENFLFVVPAVTIFAIFYIFPFYYIFQLSLYEWDGISLQKHFIWFDNFKDLLQDKIWWSSLGHAGYITLIALTFQNAFAFLLALACDREIKMKRFYSVVFFIPPVLSEVVVGLIWKWILDAGNQNGEPVGLLNYMLMKSGFPHLVHAWLSEPQTVLTCIAVVHSWKGFGWGFLMFLAGLQTIDRQLYEAARVDGAGRWSIFRHVTIPNMLPVIVVVMILTILGSMQVFILILSMVSQGLGYHTDVPVTRIWEAMTGTRQYGYACAQGVTFGIILVVISFVSKKFLNRVKQA